MELWVLDGKSRFEDDASVEGVTAEVEEASAVEASSGTDGLLTSHARQSQDSSPVTKHI